MFFDAFINGILRFSGEFPVLFWFLIALFSLVILVKASDMLLFGIAGYAKKFGISEYVIGILVVSIGTALPELMAAVIGTLRNDSGIVLGTAIGSNLFKAPGIGIVLLAVGAISLKSGRIKGRTAFLSAVMVILPLIFLLNGILSRFEGGILLAAYLAYAYIEWTGGAKLGRLKSVPIKFVLKDMLIFLGSLAALLLSARWLVFSLLQLSEIFGIPTLITGLVIIGIGASIPEISLQIRSIKLKQPNLALGNVLGAFIANSTFVLGIAALINPISMPFFRMLNPFIFSFIGVLAFLVFCRAKKLTRVHGMVFLLIYLIFVLVEFL